MASHGCIEAIARKGVSSINLTSPHDKSCQSLSLARPHTCSLSLLRGNRITVQLSQDENGGFVTATGLTETSGTATMRGGGFAGSFVVGTGDGTPSLASEAPTTAANSS